MKTTKQITVEEIRCDKCGGEVVYSGSVCIVCGKHYCEKCNDMLFYDFKTPRYFNLHDYGECQSPYVRACPGCKNDITRGMVKLKKIVDQWNNDRDYYRRLYTNLENKVFSAVNRREDELRQ